MNETIYFSTFFQKVGPVLPNNSSFQCFSLPESIVYYISRNDIPKINQKLFKCCKYFLRNQRYVVLTNFTDNKYTMIATHNVNKSWTKMWIVGEKISLYFNNTFAKISSKVCYVNVESLYLYLQNIFYTDFLLLVQSGNVKKFIFSNSTIKYSRKNCVELADILEKLPMIKKFTYINSRHGGSPILTLKTIKKMSRFLYFPELQKFIFSDDDGINYSEDEHMLNFKNKHPFATFALR